MHISLKKKVYTRTLSQDLLEEMDQDGDGHINYEEFHYMMSNSDSK